MRDDYLSADWARHHSSIVVSFNKLVEMIATTFVQLNAHQFGAPWRHEPRV